MIEKTKCESVRVDFIGYRISIANTKRDFSQWNPISIRGCNGLRL